MRQLNMFHSYGKKQGQLFDFIRKAIVRDILVDFLSFWQMFEVRFPVCFLVHAPRIEHNWSKPDSSWCCAILQMSIENGNPETKTLNYCRLTGVRSIQMNLYCRSVKLNANIIDRTAEGKQIAFQKSILFLLTFI